MEVPDVIRSLISGQMQIGYEHMCDCMTDLARLPDLLLILPYIARYDSDHLIKRTSNGCFKKKLRRENIVIMNAHSRAVFKYVLLPLYCFRFQ